MAFSKSTRLAIIASQLPICASIGGWTGSALGAAYVLLAIVIAWPKRNEIKGKEPKAGTV